MACSPCSPVLVVAALLVAGAPPRDAIARPGADGGSSGSTVALPLPCDPCAARDDGPPEWSCTPIDDGPWLVVGTVADLAVALAAHFPTIELLPGEYAVDDTLVIPGGTHLRGNEAVIDAASWETTGGASSPDLRPIIRITGGDVCIEGVTIRGPGERAIDVDEGITWEAGAAIICEGAANPGAPPTWIDRVHLSSIRIVGATQNGVVLTFVRDFSLENLRIEGYAYCGVAMVSCSHGHVSRTWVRGEPPGRTDGETWWNAYGITASRLWGPEIEIPDSEEIDVVDCVVEDVRVWKGFDTHGGRRIRFIRPTTRRCRRGVWLVGFQDPGGRISVPTDCAIIDPTIIDPQGDEAKMLPPDEGIVIIGVPGTIYEPTVAAALRNDVCGGLVEGYDGPYQHAIIVAHARGSLLRNIVLPDGPLGVYFATVQEDGILAP